MMKKLLLVIFFATTALHSQQLEESLAEFSPLEVKSYILSIVSRSRSLQEAIQSFTSLSETNKEFLAASQIEYFKAFKNLIYAENIFEGVAAAKNLLTNPFYHFDPEEYADFLHKKFKKYTVPAITTLLNTNVQSASQIMGSDEKKAVFLFFGAINNGDLKKVYEFIAAGIDPNTTLMGKTALGIASRYGNLRVTAPSPTSVLRADLYNDANDPTGKNIASNLHPVFIEIQNYKTIVDLLIDAHADLNAQDYEGNTALMMAIANETFKIAKKLIEAGANINITNNEGETALDIGKKMIPDPTELKRYPNFQTVYNEMMDLLIKKMTKGIVSKRSLETKLGIQCILPGNPYVPTKKIKQYRNDFSAKKSQEQKSVKKRGVWWAVK